MLLVLLPEEWICISHDIHSSRGFGVKAGPKGVICHPLHIYSRLMFRLGKCYTFIEGTPRCPLRLAARHIYSTILLLPLADISVHSPLKNLVTLYCLNALPSLVPSQYFCFCNDSHRPEFAMPSRLIIFS